MSSMGLVVSHQYPTVSVLMPVRNGERFIAESVMSILSQSYGKFELIVVDDASTDGTKDAVLRFRDSRIVWLDSAKPAGLVNALNRGIEAARGDFIARLDCDDLAAENRLARQVDVLRSNPQVGLVGSWMRTFGQKVRAAKYPISDPDIRLWMLFGTPFGHPAVMFRRRWMDGAAGFYDKTFELAEDFELWTRISRTWKAVNIPTFLTRYRIHPSQATRHDLRRRADCVSKIVDAHHRSLGLPTLPKNPTYREFSYWWKRLEESNYARTALVGADFKSVWRRQLLRMTRDRVLSGAVSR